MFVKLYTTPTCSYCPAIKQQLKKAGVEFEELDATQPEVLDQLRSLHVASVPYLHAENQYGSEMKALGRTIDAEAVKGFMQ